MRFDKRHKNRITIDGLYIVKDVKANQLKKLKIPYTIYKNGYNYEFLVERQHLVKLINLVEDRFRPYWQKIIDNEVRSNSFQD